MHGVYEKMKRFAALNPAGPDLETTP